MTLFPVPAFSDNYIWVLHNGERAVVVDPGQAEGVWSYLSVHGLQLDTILITHHHADHVGGVPSLRERSGARVIGPARETMPEPLLRVSEGSSVQALGLHFDVIDVPGHTAGHIAFYCAETGGTPLLFCGDTLFSGGCGRLFEGTPADMLASLNKLAALPANTRVCCTHEYTLSNLRFALAVEPHNPTLLDHQARCIAWRSQNLPTLPSSIGLERSINPFLRTAQPTVVHAARTKSPLTPDNAVSVFATLREWKNTYP